MVCPNKTIFESAHKLNDRLISNDDVQEEWADSPDATTPAGDKVIAVVPVMRYKFIFQFRYAVNGRGLIQHQHLIVCSLIALTPTTFRIICDSNLELSRPAEPCERTDSSNDIRPNVSRSSSIKIVINAHLEISTRSVFG